MKYLYMITFFLLISISCGQKSIDKIESNYLENYISKFDIDDNTKWLIILPGLGCHGCIQEAEAFMRDHIKNKNILFILTKVSSIKILQQKIGINLVKQSNVIIDKADDFTIPSDNIIYPCIIKMEKGSMVAHEFQSPKNGGAFAKLNSVVSVQ